MTAPHSSPSSPNRAGAARTAGETRSKQGGQPGSGRDSDPQLPHEVDESRHSQARASERQVEVGKKAYEDTIGPTEDTDRGPVADAVYNDKLAPDRGDAPPRH